MTAMAVTEGTEQRRPTKVGHRVGRAAVARDAGIELPESRPTQFVRGFAFVPRAIADALSAAWRSAAPR